MIVSSVLISHISILELAIYVICIAYVLCALIYSCVVFYIIIIIIWTQLELEIVQSYETKDANQLAIFVKHDHYTDQMSSKAQIIKSIF